jgi:hypothetical protein
VRVVVELTQREADELMRDGDAERWYARNAESAACVSRELGSARQKVRDAIVKADVFAKAHP